MTLHHWNYFLSAEEDISVLSRYIEFTSANFDTYSLELARVFMAATQEIDVVLKQICALKGRPGRNESDYRISIPALYPNISSVEVEVARHDIKCTPFSSWALTPPITPDWWTANNKVKHERHTHYNEASLKNVINAVSGLFIANLYYHDATGEIGELFPSPRHLNIENAIVSVSPTDFGTVANFQAP